MPWVKLDDHFPDHEKLAQCEVFAPLCGWLYVCALAYCNRQLTDGRIPKGHIYRLVNFRHIQVVTGGVGKGKDRMVEFTDDIDVDELARWLVSVGLWEEDEADYIIHDYLDYQPSREAVIADRNATAGRVATWRKHHPKVSSNSGGNAVTNAVTNGGSNAVSTPAPVPVPVPLSSGSKNEPSDARDYDDGFDTFWANYPKHVAKADAQKAWKRLKPSEGLQSAILAAVADQRTWRTWQDVKFVPNAATWLNAKRWDDERPADDRPTNRAPPVNGKAWCEHDPPCHHQQEHIARMLEARRAMAQGALA